MKQLLFISLISLLQFSCISYSYIPLKSNYANDGVSFESKAQDDLFNKTRSIVRELDGSIMREERQSGIDVIQFEIKKTSWTWENSKGLDKPDAYLVIKKFRDIGANEVRKPLSLVSTWKVQITGSKIEIKLLDAVANYYSGKKLTDTDAGYSLGNLERIIKERLDK